MLNGHYKQTFSDKNKHFQTKSDIFRQKQTFSDKNRRFQTKKNRRFQTKKTDVFSGRQILLARARTCE